MNFLADSRSRKLLAIVALLVASWVVMTTTHEVGHLIGGWISGGELQAFDLAPWRLPYSLHRPDPRPLITLWCGPIIGILLPAGIAAILRERWGWFVADFCLIANGCYLATGWYSGERYLDTSQMLQSGTPPAALAVFCGITILLGYTRFRRDCIMLMRSQESTPADSDL